MPIIIILLIILVFPGLISSVLLMGASLAISILKVFVVVGAILAVCLIIGSFFGWLSNPKKQPSEKIRGFLDGLNIFFIIIGFLAAINLIVCLLWHLADCDWFCEETIHPAILYSIIIIAVAVIYHFGFIRYTYGPSRKSLKKQKNESKACTKDGGTMKFSSDTEKDSLTLLCGKNLAIKQAGLDKCDSGVVVYAIFKKMQTGILIAKKETGVEETAQKDSGKETEEICYGVSPKARKIPLKIVIQNGAVIRTSWDDLGIKDITPTSHQDEAIAIKGRHKMNKSNNSGGSGLLILIILVVAIMVIGNSCGSDGTSYDDDLESALHTSPSDWTDGQERAMNDFFEWGANTNWGESN